MKSIVATLIRVLRYCFYNTPVRKWRITVYLNGQIGRLAVGNDPYPVIAFEGVKLKVDGNDGIIAVGLLNREFEPFTIKIFHSLVREMLRKTNKPCAFVDVGANIGVFAVTAAAMDARLQVLAFEPNPTSYQLLLDNIELNNLRNVVPTNAAVGAAPGMASLDISSGSAGLHSIYGKGEKRIEIPVVSLDDFFLVRDRRPCLFKVDVEGYEPMVLQGMKGLLQNSPLQVILEFNPELLMHGGKDPAQFLKELDLEFDAIYCLGETERRIIHYQTGDTALERKINSLGYNMLLIKGETPECLGLV